MDSLGRIIELARMAQWFETNRTRFKVGRQEDADACFATILDPLHLGALGEVLRTWLAESEGADGRTGDPAAERSLRAERRAG